MMAVHNHPGYSNCPRCVKRILELEKDLAAMRFQAERQKARAERLDGLVKDYELWCLEMGRTPIAREPEEK